MKLGAHTQSKWMDIVYLMLNLECEDETIACHHCVGAVKKMHFKTPTQQNRKHNGKSENTTNQKTR